MLKLFSFYFDIPWINLDKLGCADFIAVLMGKLRKPFRFFLVWRDKPVIRYIRHLKISVKRSHNRYQVIHAAGREHHPKNDKNQQDEVHRFFSFQVFFQYPDVHHIAPFFLWLYDTAAILK